MIIFIKTKWNSLSLSNKLSAIGIFISLVMAIFTVIIYFVPQTPTTNRALVTAQAPKIKRISIPILIRNELTFNAHIDPQVEYYLVRPETPAMDSQIESGVVRLEQPHNITAVNGNYVISPKQEMQSHFLLPASHTLTKALALGGFKLRIKLTNKWVEHYSEFKEVIFDQKILKDAIRITFFKENKG